MDEERKVFMFFRSYFEAASTLSDKEEQAEYLMAICRYALNGETPELSGAPAAMFILSKPNLDVSIKRANAGRRGGQATPKQNASKTEANPQNPEAIKDKGQGTRDKEQGIQDKGTSPPTPSAGGTQEQAFDEFWALYPRKKSKGQAKKAWDKLNPSAETISAIMEKLPELISSPDWNRDGGRYIPYPATWLNAEGWNDEPDQHTMPSQSPPPELTPEEKEAKRQFELQLERQLEQL